MGTAYKIRCKHCGAQFSHSANTSYGLFSICIGSIDRLGEIETQSAMRCPVCLKRLNTTPEEFNEQVKVTYSWE